MTAYSVRRMEISLMTILLVQPVCCTLAKKGGLFLLFDVSAFVWPVWCPARSWNLRNIHLLTDFYHRWLKKILRILIIIAINIYFAVVNGMGGHRVHGPATPSEASTAMMSESVSISYDSRHCADAFWSFQPHPTPSCRRPKTQIWNSLSSVRWMGTR